MNNHHVTIALTEHRLAALSSEADQQRLARTARRAAVRGDQEAGEAGPRREPTAFARFASFLVSLW
jgi:hypothetical protein